MTNCQAVPPTSVKQCHPAVPISAQQPVTAASQRCLSVLPISATYQCPSFLHISAASSVPPHQCPPVLPHQCHFISAAYQCPSVLPICATSSVPISAAYQCSPSTHTSEGEKL
ncbi:unnamed protein product, partial [Staurois parvus]